MNTSQTIIIIILCTAAMLTSAALYLRQRARRRIPERFDLMEPHEFARYCAEALKRNGFRGIEQLGANILAEKDGVTYAVLCSCSQTPVDVSAIQSAYAGREYHGKMVGAVLTSQHFTPQAAEAAGKLKILLWDREELERM